MKEVKLSFLLLLAALFTISCGSEGPEEAPNIQADEDYDVVNDGDFNPPAAVDADVADCNYSSADNRLRPKNEELLFSGIVFGERSLTKYIYIMNRCYNCDESNPLVVSAVKIVDENGAEDAGSFVIDSNPLFGDSVSLLNDEEIGVGVSVTSQTWSDQVRYLRIVSNDKCKPNFDILLTAQTKPTSKISVKTIDDDDPDDGLMVFSDVSGELVNRIEVTNEGKAPLKLLSVSITEEASLNANEMGFFVQDAPQPSFQIAPDESFILNIGCRNDKEHPSPLNGELLISNNDPTEYGANSKIRVALKCGPNVESAPTAVLKCEPEKVSVLQWAVMDGGDSVDSDGQSKDDLKYLWGFASTPSGISLDIVDDSNRAGSSLNGDPSNKISRAAFQAKMKGNYVVRLIVLNSQGVSSKPAECAIEAVSDDDLAIKLLWNNKNADLDLHLVKPDGTYGDPLADCYYWNCSPQYSGERPDWGIVDETKDDPYLDLDNTTGIGPETITVNKPEKGTYKVIVHAYDLSKGPATAVVKTYVHAEEANSSSLFMNETDTCWDVFEIEVSEGEGSSKNLMVKEISPVQAYPCARPSQN